MTATQMLDELDVRTTPDGRKRIFSMKFCTNEGKLHYFPQVYITGVNNMDMKRARYRGVQPCCTQGNPEGHLFPVKITNILELDGHPIDWSNGYKEDPSPAQHFNSTDMDIQEFIKKWLVCRKDFLIFKKGEHYWLELCADGRFCVRSDNALGQYARISQSELFQNFEQTKDNT